MAIISKVWRKIKSMIGFQIRVSADFRVTTSEPRIENHPAINIENMRSELQALTERAYQIHFLQPMEVLPVKSSGPKSSGQLDSKSDGSLFFTKNAMDTEAAIFEIMQGERRSAV